jgi:hypothetical protein
MLSSSLLTRLPISSSVGADVSRFTSMCVPEEDEVDNDAGGESCAGD